MIENFDVLKENNLRQMVAEYESETKGRDVERKACLCDLESYGKRKTTVIMQNCVLATENAMADMKRHYETVFERMVLNYKVIDLALQAYKNDNEYIPMPSHNFRPITNKKQLREIVNVFNNCQRR